MSLPFRLTPQGYSARFEPAEIQILTRLFEDVALTLEPDQDPDADPLATLVGISEIAQAPSDPALARLLPPATSDPQQAAEYRRFTELTLRQQKISNLRLAAMTLQSGQVNLTQEQAGAWASALGDTRLTLAARLGIDSPQAAERIGETTDPEQVESTEDYMALLYNLLSWLQESLAQALLEGLDRQET